MTIREALSLTHLASLDAEVLMSHALERDRSFVLAHGDVALTEMQKEQFQSFVRRREEGEPVAYIINEKEFYGRSFFVDPRVLIPRPSTEGLIDATLDFLSHPRNSIREIDAEIVAVSHVCSGHKPAVILDIGTGSGCIAITLRLEGCSEKIIGVDVSGDALSVARTNDIAWVTELTWVESDGVEIVQKMKEPFLVVSNPPYIPEGTELPNDVSSYEPHNALFAGISGTDVIRPLITACEQNPACSGYVMEMREDQLSPPPPDSLRRIFPPPKSVSTFRRGVPPKGRGEDAGSHGESYDLPLLCGIVRA